MNAKYCATIPPEAGRVLDIATNQFGHIVLACENGVYILKEAFPLGGERHWTLDKVAAYEITE